MKIGECSEWIEHGIECSECGEYDVDFVNAMLLNWPSLKYLTLYTCSNAQVSNFLENVKFEHCESLESVEVKNADMTRLFFSKEYPNLKGK